MTQTNANGNNTYNKPFTIRIDQIFSCFLKITELIKMKHYLQRNSKSVVIKKKKKNAG